MKQLRKFHNQSSMLNFYHAFVIPSITYGITVWGRTTDRDRVFLIQKKIIRLIFNLNNRDSCRPIFKNNKLLTYYGIYTYEVLTFLCKHYDSFGVKETNKYCTRNTEITLKHKTAFFEKSVSYTGLKMFHSLPQEIKCLKDNKFKKKTKRISCNNCALQYFRYILIIFYIFYF